jgi:hypothetical protein
VRRSSIRRAGSGIAFPPSGRRTRQPGGVASTLPTGTSFEPKPLTLGNDELETITPQTPKPTVNTAQASLDNLSVQVPTAFNPASVTGATADTTTLTPAQAAQGNVSTGAIVDPNAVVGQLSNQSIAQAQTEQLDEKATVKYQLGELYKSIEEGKPLPAWASGPVRTASAIMQQRGLGKSSMAAAAISLSVIEAGLPIAAADAGAFATIQLQNLNNRQQTALSNAANFAAMDLKNADNRTQALVNNSRAFLAIDTQNLTNEQQANMLDNQSRVQALFSNQAAENAARTFNATSQNQVDQFFAQLQTATLAANSDRTAATEQFNTNEANAMTRYESSLIDSRDKYYQEMQRQINQSNVMWRREINTANTAAENEATRINAQNLLGISADAQNRMWQQYRDEARFLMDSSENNASRAHNAAMLASQQNFSIETYNKAAKDNFWQTVGTAVAAIL